MNKESVYILLISCLVVFYSCERRGETHKPSIMDVTEAVYSSVTIQPDSLYEVYASVNGIIQSVELAEGDSVFKGDLLLRISNTVPELNAQNAKLALDQARINAGKNSSILGSIQDEIKSTLLYILSTMDTSYDGELYINENIITGQSADNLATLRNKHIGFVFQFHYLLPELSVLQNVSLPAKKLGLKSSEEIEQDALQILKKLGVGDQANKLSSKVSGGQK